MSRNTIMKKVAEILGVKTGNIFVVPSFYYKCEIPDIICTIQDFNMGGSYFRNFYINDGRIHMFISDTNYFSNEDDYKHEQLENFIWKRVLIR